MTKNQMVFAIAEAHGKQNDNIYIERLKFAVDYWAAFLIRQDIEKNGHNSNYIQTINLPLILVDKNDACSMKLGCSILRTKDKVPQPLDTKSAAPFIWVGSPNKQRAFGYITLARVPFRSKKGIYYIFENGYLYVYGTLKLECLTVSSAFAEPNVVLGCASDDEPYPITSHLVKTIVEGLTNNSLELRVRSSEIETRDKVELN